MFEKKIYGFTSKKHSNFQVILSEPGWNLIIYYILQECKSKKTKIAILELKNPYEQIFVGHPVFLHLIFYYDKWKSIKSITFLTIYLVITPNCTNL